MCVHLRQVVECEVLEGERENTLEPFALHAPIHWAIQGGVVAGARAFVHLRQVVEGEVLGGGVVAVALACMHLYLT